MGLLDSVFGGGGGTVEESEAPKWWQRQAKQGGERFWQQINDPRAATIYGGPRVAGMAPNQLMAGGIASLPNPTYGAIGETYGRARGLGGDFNVSMMDPYFNRYNEQVLGDVQRRMHEGFRMSLEDISGEAASTGAFGMGNERIQSVLYPQAIREFTEGLGDVTHRVQAEGFDKAAGLAQAEYGMEQQYGLGAVGAQTQLASLYGQTRVSDIQNLLATGAIDQSTAQAMLDAERSRFEEWRDRPITLTERYLAGIGAGPTTSASSQPQDPNPLTQMAGLAGLLYFGGAFS